MRTEKLYRLLASKVGAYVNCVESGNDEWRARHRESVERLVKEFMPSGAGIDCGTKFDFDASNGERLVFVVDFHHLDSGGGYDGWTRHFVTVKASLQFGFRLSISGRNRNDIKEYLGDVYGEALGAVIVTEYDAVNDCEVFKIRGEG